MARKLILKATGKITRMGRRRQKVVEDIINDAADRGLTITGISRKLKRDADTPTGEDRDWTVVAQTELTDTIARRSLRDIVAEHGKNAKVYRKTGDPCPVCLAAFGRPRAPRMWTVSKIPEAFVGAVHPRCRCRPWQIASISIKKSESAHWGDVEIVDDKPFINNGAKWFQMDSEQGKHLLMEVLQSIPLIVMVDTNDEYAHGKHGYAKREGKYVLVDMKKLSNVTVLPGGTEALKNLPCEKVQDRSTKSISVGDYLSIMKKTLPLIATLPDFWKKKTVRHLADFIGYGTMTDFDFIMPKEIPERAIVGEGDTSKDKPRRKAKAVALELIPCDGCH